MALADHVKAVIYGTIATTLSAGVIAVILWLKGLPLHWALLVTGGFILAVAMAAYLVSLIIVQFRKPKPDADKEPATNQHEGCERAITNLQTKNRTLEERDTTWGIQVQARDGQIASLQKQYDETDWLREIADKQKKDVRSYLRDDAWEAPFNDSLLIEPLFIDFRFAVYSSSAFPLSATGISGAVRFANDRLTGGKAEITRNELDDLEIGQTGWLTITQPLNRADAVRILNQSNSFYFDQVTIELTSPRLEKAIKLNPRHSVENKALLEKYPKLEIEITSAFYDWIIAFGSGRPRKQPCYVTLYLTITNGRPVPVSVETFRLTLVVKGKEYVSFPEDRVYRRRYVNDHGVEVADGEHSQNLNKPPLVLTERKPATGTLQFIFNDLDWMDIITEGLDDSLNDSHFTLLLTDKDGERHLQRGTVQHRDKAQTLFEPE